MLETIRKCIAMLPAGTWPRWWLLAPLALVVTAVEAASAAMIFAVFQVLNNPSNIAAIPWLSAIVTRLPAGDSNRMILQLMALAALCHVVKTMLAVLVHYLRTRLNHDATAGLSAQMLRRYLAAPYPFHFHRNSADLIRNCTTAIGEGLGVVLSACVTALSELLVFAGLAAVLLNTAPGLSVAAGAVVVLLLFVTLRATREAAVRLGAQTHEEASGMLKTLNEAFSGIKELKVLARESYFFEEFEAHQRRVQSIVYQGIALGYVPAVVIQAVMVVGGLLMVAVLLWLGGPGPQILPTIGLFGYAALRLMPTATWLLNTLTMLRGATRAVDDLYRDFLDLSSAAEAAAAPAPGLAFHEAITLDGVTYQYPGADSPALHDVNLRIRRGESVGIVGPTGAGKSTLVDVVLGLLPPTAGQVDVDGVPLGRDGVRWLRRVGYVPQSLYLIDDTLSRNIALGIAPKDVDRARLARAAELAQLDGLLARLPAGLDTLAGERGVRLSGGERQRIAIARALYHDPDFLVLDEATSALDLATEAEVMKTIDQLKGVKTMLIVSHRLTTLRHCDRIVLLRQGQVEGVGTFDELNASHAGFRALAALAAM